CTAVGSYVGASPAELTLAEVWNGSSWSVQTTPNPVGGYNTALEGVSCTPPCDCIAVGNSTSGAFSERWDGTSWSLQSIPNPPGASLAGVSCTSPSACTAVGRSSSGTPAEAWDGSSWPLLQTPPPARA